MAEKDVSVRAVSIASTTPSGSWKGWLWDSADVSKEERRFLLKVDNTLSIINLLLF
jgi:MFS transporter, ACS family, pantothenate transporter